MQSSWQFVPLWTITKENVSVFDVNVTIWLSILKKIVWIFKWLNSLYIDVFYWIIYSHMTIDNALWFYTIIPTLNKVSPALVNNLIVYPNKPLFSFNGGVSLVFFYHRQPILFLSVYSMASLISKMVVVCFQTKCRQK